MPTPNRFLTVVGTTIFRKALGSPPSGETEAKTLSDRTEPHGCGGHSYGDRLKWSNETMRKWKSCTKDEDGTFSTGIIRPGFFFGGPPQGYRIKIRELASIASQGCIVRGSPVWSSIIREQKRPREALSGGEKLNAIALCQGTDI